MGQKPGLSERVFINCRHLVVELLQSANQFLHLKRGVRCPFQQIIKRGVYRFGDIQQQIDGHTAFAMFDFAEVIYADIKCSCQCLLRHPPPFPQSPQPTPEFGLIKVHFSPSVSERFGKTIFQKRRSAAEIEKCAQPTWLCAYAGKAHYGRYNSQVCGKHTESAKAGRFRASAMGVMRDLPAVNANETVYRNALILAILLAANSFYHTSAPIARIKVPLFCRSHLYSIRKTFFFQH